MTNTLIINSNSSETRVASLVNNKLAEISIERSTAEGLVGNIYKAKVSRVLPGMQSAFIDIGLDRAAFLYGGDVIDFKVFNKLRSRRDKLADDHELQNFREAITGSPVEKVLQPGMEINVQITKDPIGTKGARASMFLSIPGRYLVIVPDSFHVGISRRIEDDQRRAELVEQVESLKPDDAGFIIRTAALEASPELLAEDVDYLIKQYTTLRKSSGTTSAPGLLYKEPPIYQKITRDMYSSAVSEIIVDNPQVYEELADFLQLWIPEARDKLILYQGEAPIFDEFGIEMDIAKALGKKVWLPSGGYLVIEQTEALTSFDVNTGRFVGKLSVKDTIRKTNLEAVAEIASQLKLRNIGGLIVIDLIDMDAIEDRELVVHTLQDYLKSDKARSNVLSVSELGLVEMTRKRTDESLERKLTVHCSHCDGSGKVKSHQTVALDLIRDIQRQYLRTRRKEISVVTTTAIRDWVYNQEGALFEDVCREWELTVSFSTENLEPHSVLAGAPYELT